MPFNKQIKLKNIYVYNVLFNSWKIKKQHTQLIFLKLVDIYEYIN